MNLNPGLGQTVTAQSPGMVIRDARTQPVLLVSPLRGSFSLEHLTGLRLSPNSATRSSSDLIFLQLSFLMYLNCTVVWRLPYLLLAVSFSFTDVSQSLLWLNLILSFRPLEDLMWHRWQPFNISAQMPLCRRQFQIYSTLLTSTSFHILFSCIVVSYNF